MAKPLPDYVPETIRAVIKSKVWGKRGLAGWASQAGVDDDVVRETFSGLKTNRSLTEFEEFCRAVGKPMDEVLLILRKPENTRRQELKDLIYKHYSSIQELAESDQGVSDGYVEQLFRGDTGGAVLSIYWPMSSAIGMTLEQFATFVPRGRAQ